MSIKANNQSQYTPIIIIGAPRSGTNMLRDVLCKLPGFRTWPCDEINYIWRHGNKRCRSDELLPENASHEVSLFIKSKFDWVASKFEAEYVVEKTCANSLRVPFVNTVIPDAKYIFIYRDGIDVAGSALMKWKAPADLRYLMSKIRFVPLTDIFYYAIRYLSIRCQHALSSARQGSIWGPQFEGMKEEINSKSMLEICAIQWQKCVEKAEEGLASLSQENVVRVCYEEFVKNPCSELGRVLHHLQLEVDEREIAHATTFVSAQSIGKGYADLSSDQVELLKQRLQSTMVALGYDAS